MAEWEISLSPDEVEKIIEAHIKAEYGIENFTVIEAVNGWSWVTVKMGDYPPSEPVG